ncbi:phosphoribosyltransferase-like protein [Methylobacterium oryzae CBMB20]
MPAIQEVRQGNGETREPAIITQGLAELKSKTRFLGVGTPSESGVHLLYYFRQENRLKKQQFLDTAQILERDTSGGAQRVLRYPNVNRYVFVDDVCGSGDTANRYSRDFLEEVKSLNPSVKFYYLAMFGKADGLEFIRKNTVFGENVAAVFELDETYKCLSHTSRYLRVVPSHIDAETIRLIAKFYGERLYPGHGAGFDDSQLLMGFHHNTPDNTLPIMWMDPDNGSTIPWRAIFRRYPKI